ncbi:methyltransferase, TIGR04325 family [Variovorax rhizosphaerae]|uniref:Methyltransferase, TIGR04325 family n=1 Tax=Variovorax rhizosphaerae TaxID=1836200 RepID=A0ABU8WU15_9BURK
MTLLSFARHLREVMNGPLVRPALIYLKQKEFFTPVAAANCFGVFDSFDAARAWLPPNEEFDHSSLAKEYVEDRTQHVFAYDYPVMWWLERAFNDGATSLFDIGGSVGVHYYAYRHYFKMPADLLWVVAEVPAMVAIGRDLAQKNQVTALQFTENLEGGTDASVWLSAGAFHYLDVRFDQLLLKSSARPRHILLNKLPLYDGEDFVTTQNLGDGCFAPTHVYNRARFIREIEALGYTCVDAWKVLERSLHIPGHEERSIAAFTGLYFSRSSSPATGDAGEVGKPVPLPPTKEAS